jgi:hypothetical protein
MGKLGQEGVEKLTTHLNLYFTKVRVNACCVMFHHRHRAQLVNLVNKYGGDIVKYAGDAIFAQVGKWGEGDVM